MNSEPSKQDPVDGGPELEEAVVLLYRLSTEATRRIQEVRTNLKIDFADAALRTGVITQSELDKAVEWVQQSAADQDRSLIERVMRRGGPQREVVLWTGDQLVPAPELIIAHQSMHPRSEVLRSLRTELLMRLNGVRGRSVFALLSPLAGEGRSQLAAELAIAFAQLGRRTLLVDADLRRPRQHVLFNSENDYGLVHALTANDNPRLRGVRGLPTLALLNSGPLPPNPAELLSGIRFERLTAEWRRNFEFVVIDTPPTSEFSDGFAVASAAGHVLVVSRAEATTYAALDAFSRKLQATQALPLGAVLNRF